MCLLPTPVLEDAPPGPRRVPHGVVAPEAALGVPLARILAGHGRGKVVDIAHVSFAADLVRRLHLVAGAVSSAEAGARAQAVALQWDTKCSAFRRFETNAMLACYFCE